MAHILLVEDDPGIVSNLTEFLKKEGFAIFRRRQVGLIYQFYNLIPVLNVTENMTLPVLMDGREVNQQRLEELLSLLSPEEKKEHLLRGGRKRTDVMQSEKFLFENFWDFSKMVHEFESGIHRTWYM